MSTISIFCDPVFRSVRHWVVFQRPCHADIASNSRREYIVKRNFSRLAPTVELWQNCWRIFGEQSGQQHGGNLGDPNKRFANHIFKQLSAIFKKSCKLNIEKGILIVSELEAGGFSTGVCSMS